MKFVKLSVLALAMGLFVASCGNSESTENEETMPETTETEMTAPEAPAPVDTMSTTPADTTMAAPAEPAH